MDGRDLSTDLEALEQLRELLFGEELAQLKAIRRDLKRFPTPEEVARALPAAVALCDEKGVALREALAPPVEQALKVSVRENPQPLLDVIFPLLGPAIRRAVQSALRGAVQSLNQAMEYSLNPHFRFQAWRSGLSFPEYVLLATLIYRVEHVFLIHNETGLVLAQADDPEAETTDADMVAGMLSAIQSFMADSFKPTAGDTLEEVQYGELALLVIGGSDASLTLAVRGQAPEELRVRAQELLEGIHFRDADALEDFDGDTAPFEACRPLLERLIESQSKPPSSVPSRAALMAVGVAVIVIGLGLGYATVHEMRFRSMLGQLEAEPGVLVTRVERGPTGTDLFGLRDPLSADPDPVVRAFDPDIRTHWESIQSNDMVMTRKRVQQILAPPQTVKLLLEDGTLRAVGRATSEWIERTRLLAPTLPGVEHYIEAGLEDLDPLNRVRAQLGTPDSVVLALDGRHLVASGVAENAWIRAATERLEKHPDVDSFDVAALENLEESRLRQKQTALQSRYIYFQEGTTVMKEPASSVLDQTARDWAAIVTMADKLQRAPVLTLIGQSDAVGTREINERLSLERARLVQNELVRRGLKQEMKVDSLISPNEDPRLRRVLFQLDLR
ncbi:MAG: OmpA family protein [Vulcanimicrobiota bacterium]